MSTDKVSTIEKKKVEGLTLDVEQHASILESMSPRDRRIEANRLEFRTDDKAAILEARQSGKPLAVVFTSPDCAWCAALDKQLADPKLKNLQDRAIFLKVDVGAQGTLGRALYDRIGASGYPVTSVMDIDKNGDIKERSRINGYYPASEMNAKFQTAFDRDLPQRAPVALATRRSSLADFKAS